MFQELVLTLVVIFVLFKLFGQNNSGDNNPSTKKPEGKTKVDFIPKNKNPRKNKVERRFRSQNRTVPDKKRQKRAL